MQLPPVEVLLSWPTPNYVDPTDTRGPQLLIITFIFFPIALFFVALRMFTRLQISKSFGVDDVFLLAAIFPTTACAVLTSLAVQRWGWDRHIWDVHIDLLSLGLKLTIAMEVLFGISVSFTKISLLILTRRIMVVGTGILRHVAAAGMVVVACEGIIFCIVVIWTCSPVSAYWTLSLTPQNCINERIHLLIGGIINTMTDFLVFFLPLPTVVGLQIPRRQQLILFFLFGAGFIVCVAGTVRIVYAYKTTSTYDRTWESYGLWIASVLELYIGIICASIPACKPFFSRYIPSLLSSSSGSTKPSKNSTQKPSSSANSHSRKESLPSEPSNDDPVFDAIVKGPPSYELQTVLLSKFNTRGNSNQLLPLSFLDNNDETVEHEVSRKESNEASIGSFIGNPKPTTTRFSTGRISVRELGKIGRAESREGLVEKK